MIYPSQDGNYWLFYSAEGVCHETKGKRCVYCFFVPMMN